MASAYTNFQVSQQRSGSLTLSWGLSAGSLTSQTLLVDSNSTDLVTLVLDGAARSVTLSSDNITVLYGTSHNYSFRLIGDTGVVGAAKVKSATLQEQHFYQLQAPDVAIVGMPQGMMLTFADTLPDLSNYDAAQLMDGNVVSQVEVSLSYVGDSGPDLDAYVATADQIVNNGTGNVLFIGDAAAYNGGNSVGVALYDGRDYEVTVRYITSNLGFSPATLDQTVVPTDQFSAPQNVAVSRPSGDDADNSGMAVSFNGPANDINPDGSADSFVGHYEVWYKAAASAPDALTNDDLDATGNPDGWTKFTNDVSPAAGDAAAANTAFTAIETGLDEGKLYWFAVRAVRDKVTNEVEPDSPDNDGKINGLFSAPESGLVFNYTGVAAPIIEGYTTQGSTSVTVKCDYPTVQGSSVAATIFAAADVGADLAAIDYSSKFIVKYADDADGTSDLQTVEFAAAPSSSDTINGTIDFVSLGVRKYITSAVYQQTYKGVDIAVALITPNTESWDSVDANVPAASSSATSEPVPDSWDASAKTSSPPDERFYEIPYGTKSGYVSGDVLFQTLDGVQAEIASQPALGVNGMMTFRSILASENDYAQGYRYRLFSNIFNTDVAGVWGQIIPTGTTLYRASIQVSGRIFGAESQQLTTFTAPAVTSITQSLTYDAATFVPLSTSASDGDGKLAVAWTEVQTNTAWVSGENAHFYGDLKYRLVVVDADGNTVASSSLSGNEDLTAGNSTLGGLNNDVNYSLTVQVYFVNPDNAVLAGATEPAVSQEVAGDESAAVTNGTTPFYYPDPVIANTDAPSVYGDNLEKLTVTWDQPANLNGVGSAGSLTSLRYRYVLTTNGTAAQPVWVSTAYDDVTTNFQIGSGYKTAVWSGYQADGTDVYNSSSAEHDIYYAEVKPPVITLSTSAVADDSLTSGVVTATYTDGGNNAVLAFSRVNSTISTGGSQVGSAIVVTSGRDGTHSFTGLTNGTQYVVSGTATHTFGVAGDGVTPLSWTSVSSNSGAGEVLGGIPYGKPIINESTASMAGQVASVTVNPNGRFLREALFVGVPSAYSAADIGVQQTNGEVALYGSANNSVSVSVASTSFGYDLSQALFVVENAAGSDVYLKQ